MKRSNILFLCTGNSCRSQMAEGWARALHGDVMNVWSAGIETHGLNPLAVRAMADAGIDISSHRSQLVSDLPDQVFDLVVTVCDNARESCPVFSGATRLVHHSFPDPPHLARHAANEEEALAYYITVRDEIRAYVSGLPDQLAAE